MTYQNSDHFYGRRKGRPVRVKKTRLLETILPNLAVDLDEGKVLLDPQDLFSFSPKEIWLEIGFGGGEHLAELASQNPQVGFIGCEVFLNGIASFLEYHEARQLANVRLFTHDARFLLCALKPDSLAKVMIMFPDPWPKARHNKRRLVQKKTLEQLSALLVSGGELRLASDHEDYIAWMKAEIEKVASLHLPTGKTFSDCQKKPDSWPGTRYEQKALAQKIECTYFSLINEPSTAVI
tara:strand:- start:584 stop:1294 length:711 start_codon:yes stop_codon:yes gene_type:complete